MCAPSSTIDMTLSSGEEIRIEQRKPEEVTEMWYEKRMAPEGVGVVNPAFDVTDHSLVTGIITEKGIARAPFREAFEAMREFAALFDNESIEYVLDSLTEYRLPEADGARVEDIRTALSKLDWEALGLLLRRED